jgi:pimeloyl-ACP methyl ester carboxylesterase
VKEKLVTFRSFDGVSLEGTYCAPSDPPTSVVLLVHGIDSDRNEWGFYARMAAVLAEAGIASFRFDWRCYGVDRSRPISQLTLAGIANDIEAAADVLLEVSRSESLSVIAASFGGGISTAWSRHTGCNVKSLILLAPVLDYAHDYLEYEGLGSQHEGVSESASDQLDSDEYLTTSGRQFSRQLISEFPYFSASPPPPYTTLIIHGTEDTGVPYKNSVNYVGRYPQVRLIDFPGTEHGFAAPGDNDLDWPETLQNHQRVYKWIQGFLSEGDA